MKMKIIIISLVGIILLLFVPAVSTQDEEQLVGITPEAGITPDSVFYGLDVFVDNVRATLTPSSLGKAKVRLNIIQERMAEMEVMANKNKTTEAKRAELEGQKQMEKFERSIRKIDAKDAPKLNESIQIHTATLEIFKQRLMNNDNPDYDYAIAGMLRLLETSEHVIANIPEDLDPKSTFVIGSGGPGSGPADPHNCSGYYADHIRQIKWCCKDSDGTSYSSDSQYTKGTVEYKIINLRDGTIEQGIETDSCDGDTLTEWVCPARKNRVTRNERYSEEHDCPDGCQDGACIREVIEEEVPDAPVRTATNTED